MTFRGVYRDGVIYVKDAQGLRDGDVVEITGGTAHSTSRSAKRDKKNTRGGSRKSVDPKHPLPGFGAWKHRKDIGDTASFARALRERISSRTPRD